jgi:tRNA-specific 2-thiouridylase
MIDKNVIVVAMSGGVDSSVAAFLLKEQGYDVIGIMLRLWSEPGKDDQNRCCTPDSVLQAKIVASKIGIPFYILDFRNQFYEYVVKYFLQGYLNGITPNPCIVCNKIVRWGFLLEYANNLGANYFATGHYAKINRTKTDQFLLYKGTDEAKDQSYVLHMLNQEQLSKTILPLGMLTKKKVREIALTNDLPVHSRPDSQDLCFLSGDDYRDFLNKYKINKISTGNIETIEREIIGQHLGLPYYTIGQRKGLNISSKLPMYVISKDVSTNTLIVGPKESLNMEMMSVVNMNWIPVVPTQNSLQLKVKIRYKSSEVNCTVFLEENNKAKVIFSDIVSGVTPGQTAVFYYGNQCMGGGIIV